VKPSVKTKNKNFSADCVSILDRIYICEQTETKPINFLHRDVAVPKPADT